jgi:hypothetical protein
MAVSGELCDRRQQSARPIFRRPQRAQLDWALESYSDGAEPDAGSSTYHRAVPEFA